MTFIECFIGPSLVFTGPLFPIFYLGTLPSRCFFVNPKVIEWASQFAVLLIVYRKTADNKVKTNNNDFKRAWKAYKSFFLTVFGIRELKLFYERNLRK